MLILSRYPAKPNNGQIEIAFSHRSIVGTSTISINGEWWWKYALFWLVLYFTNIYGQKWSYHTLADHLRESKPSTIKRVESGSAFSLCSSIKNILTASQSHRCKRIENMALINCPECGNQMSDTAKKCPHCGYKQKKTLKLSPKNFYIASIVVAIILLIWALLLILNFNFSDPIRYEKSEVRSGCYITLFTIICLAFIGTRYKKIFPHSLRTVIIISIIDLGLIGLSFAILGCESWEQMRARLGYESYLSSSDENFNSANPTTIDYIGTYEYIQPRNREERSKLTITINDDKTAVALSEGRNEKTFYGSWTEYNGQIQLTFTDTNVHTFNGTYADLLVFTDWADQIDISRGVIYDGYLYENSSFADAKNPDHRVKLEKIN